MFTKIYIVIFAFGCLLFYSACGKKDSERFKPYFPLEVGSTWIYEIKYKSEYSSNETLSSLTVKIIRDTTIDNYPARLVEQRYSNGGVRRLLWYEKDNQLLERNSNAASEHVLYKKPLEIGDSISGGIVKSYYDEYSVTFGSFPAFEISYGNDEVKDGVTNGYYTQDIYAPGLGRIHYVEINNFYGFGMYTWRLTDYYIE